MLFVKVAILYSGGKDSNLATYIAMKNNFKIKCLISIIPKNENSYLFHFPNIKFTKLQAKSIGLPIIQLKAKNIGNKEIEDLFIALKKAKQLYNIKGVFSGVIASNYQKNRIEKICEKLNIECFSPLWNKDPIFLLNEFINLGFKAIITSVSAQGFNENWLGRILDEKCIIDLKELNKKYNVNISFEGGEAETFVLDGPIFKKIISIIEAEKIWKGYYGFYIIKKAKLINKNSSFLLA